MEPTPTARPPRTAAGRKKRILFLLIVALGLYAAAELASWCAFRFLDGRSFSFRRLQKERAACRASQPAGAPAAPGLSDLGQVIHPYLGVVNNPERLVSFPEGFPISPYGFADRGPPVHKRSPGKVIVGVVGGSMASQFCARGAAALERELKKSARFADQEFVFVNLAVGGYKQPQQLMALNYVLALGGEFDVVVNLDGFNEVALYPAENAARGIFPLYPRCWDLVVGGLADTQMRARVAEVIYRRKQRQKWARTFSRRPLCYSVTLNLAWRCLDRRLNQAAVRSARAVQTHRPAVSTYAQTGPPHGLGSPDQMFGELAGVWKRCSVQLDRLCRANGIRYYHFLQPNQYDPGTKEMGAAERKEAYLEGHPYQFGVLQGYPLLRRAGRELVQEGVRFRDLTRAFAAHQEPLYTDTCCHVNQAGNDCLAQEVARTLAETDEPPR